MILNKKVLVVDDEPGIRTLFVDTLTPMGYEVFTAAEGESAILIFDQQRPSATFVDIRMPGMDGVELVSRLKSSCPEAYIVMITGHSKDEAVERALGLGTFACLMKPFSIRDIIEMTQMADIAA